GSARAPRPFAPVVHAARVSGRARADPSEALPFDASQAGAAVGVAAAAAHAALDVGRAGRPGRAVAVLLAAPADTTWRGGVADHRASRAVGVGAALHRAERARRSC